MIFNFNKPDGSVNCSIQNHRPEQRTTAEPCQNRGFSVCVCVCVCGTTCINHNQDVERERSHAMFPRGRREEGGWRNLRLALFFFLLLLLRLPQHTFSCLSFCLCVFFRGVVSFLPPSTQINIVLCHASAYISLPCSLVLVFRKSSFLFLSFFFFFFGRWCWRSDL